MATFRIQVLGSDGVKKLQEAGFTHLQAEIVQELVDRSIISIVDGLNAHLDALHPENASTNTPREEEE